jgi:hypothetical protein
MTLLCSPLQAQWGDQVVRLGEALIWGPFHDVEVQSNRAYCAMGYGLAVFDFATPSQLQLLSAYGVPGASEGLFVLGDYAYVASGGAGLQILDIADPLFPEFVGQWDSPGYAYEILRSGLFLYLADGLGGLRVLSVADISNPVPVAGLSLGGWVRDLYLDGDYLYVAAETAGLKIVNVAGPSQPQLVGSYDTGMALGVYKSGNYAYIADGPNGVLILDVSNPALPQLVGQWATTGIAHEVDVSGIYAYVADDSPGLVVLNVNNPALPYFVGQYNSSGLAWATALSGTTLLLADDKQGISTIWIANPQAPAHLDSYSLPGEVLSVWVEGNYGYAARGSTGRIAVLDVSAPEDPELLTDYLPPGEATEAVDALVLGNICYSSHLDNGVYLSNVSTPSAPVFLTRKNTAGETVNLVPRYPYLYVADEWEGLVILSLTNPDSAWHYATSGWAKAVNLLGDTAIVSQWDAGIALVNVSNPYDLRLLDEYATSGLAHRCDVANGYIYVADDNAGLIIQSLATGSVLATYNTSGSVWDVKVAGQFAYLADVEEGLIVLDVSDPLHPLYAGSYRTPGAAQRIFLDGQDIYVADQFSLGIYRFSNVGVSPTMPIAVPSRVELAAFPNPFNAMTHLTVTATHLQSVDISVYNASGQLIERLFRGKLEAGQHDFYWQAGGASSGSYFVRLHTGNQTQVIKSILLQ